MWGKAFCNEHIQVSFMKTLDCFCSMDTILTNFLRKGCMDSPREQCNSSDALPVLESHQPLATLQAGGKVAGKEKDLLVFTDR